MSNLSELEQLRLDSIRLHFLLEQSKFSADKTPLSSKFVFMKWCSKEDVIAEIDAAISRTVKS